MKQNKKKVEEDNPFCETCGHCGFIECCGITGFLKKHVVGKTGCANEELVLGDLIRLLNYSLTDSMQQRFLSKCKKCRSDKCSGWHQVYPKKKKHK